MVYASQKKYYDKTNAWRKARRVEMRMKIVDGYGGKCSCCGESQWKFLTLDHPDGDGQKDRARYKNNLDQLYGWVINNGFPKEYRLLCMNCNWVRRYDICPHTLTKEETGSKLAE